MGDSEQGQPEGGADQLRLQTHELREQARALARQAFDARTDARILRERASSARHMSARLAAANHELRDTVEALAKSLRRLDVPPETLIVAVKGISDEAARANTLPPDRADRTAFTSDLVRWAIHAYFAA
jgi:hypothetical protein